MNTLLILFPLQTDTDSCHPYLLKVDWDKQKQQDMVKRIIDAIKMIDHEDFEGFYDKKQRNQFYHSVVNKAEYPNASMILTYLKDWKEAKQPETGQVSVKEMTLTHDCLGALNNKTGCAIVDVEALQEKSAKALQLKGKDGKLMHVDIVECSAQSLYQWFVDNRKPQRILDENYAKHSKQVKSGPRGEISALTYSKEDTEYFLKRAVGVKGERRMCYWVKEDKKIIIFFNENLASPTFHAYEIADDNAKELQKIANDVKKKMEKATSFQ